MIDKYGHLSGYITGHLQSDLGSPPLLIPDMLKAEIKAEIDAFNQLKGAFRAKKKELQSSDAHPVAG